METHGSPGPGGAPRPVDVGVAAAAMNVPKRRIYDITNVMEGCGMIVKKGKNSVMWK